MFDSMEQIRSRVEIWRNWSVGKFELTMLGQWEKWANMGQMHHPSGGVAVVQM